MSHSEKHVGLLPQCPDLSPPHRRPLRRWYHIACRCVSFTSLVLFCTSAVLLLKFPHILPDEYFKSVKAPIDFIINGPHSALFLDPKMSSFEEQAVVKPLVDRDTPFDIVATVWVRSRAAEEKEPIEMPMPTNAKDPRETSNLVEEVIFSETIFKGLTLKDKNVKTSVKLRIPTEIFKERFLHTYDLRASFVLVPTSPSLLDHAVSYSTWMPVDWQEILMHDPQSDWKLRKALSRMQYPNMRAYRSDIGPSLADRIVDAYGALTPLLEFRLIETQCDPGHYSDQHMETTGVWTKDKPILKYHPHVITRTFLRAVDMTRVYNKTLYFDASWALNLKACRDNLAQLPDWRRCRKSFQENGNAEVSIQLGAPISDENNENATLWVYAPFISAMQGAWGPLDLVPMPLNRENCAGSSNASSVQDKVLPSDIESMEVIWNITFSGRSTWKYIVADYMMATMRQAQQSSGMNAIETNKETMDRQAIVETYNGILGHPFREGSHPRRSYIIFAIGPLVRSLDTFLEALYWSTRATTTGISQSGALLVLIGDQILGVFYMVWVEFNSQAVPFRYPFLWRAFQRFLPVMPTLLTILRWKIRWYGWMPTGVETRKATHSERTSERLDARLSYQYKILAFLFLFGFFEITAKFRLTIIPAVNVVYNRDSLTGLGVTVIIAIQSIAFPCVILGRALQLLLNYRAKSFAGAYKLFAILFFVRTVLEFVSTMEMVVGPVIRSRGAGYFDLFDLVIGSGLICQAALYPRVEQQEEEDK